MLWSVKQAACYLGCSSRHIYYLIEMADVEAVKIGSIWRLTPGEVKNYDKQCSRRKYRSSTGNFIYPGSSEFLFGTLYNCLFTNKRRKAASMERQRRKLVHRPKRIKTVHHKVSKPLTQLELPFI